MNDTTRDVRVYTRWLIRRDFASILAWEADSPGGWDEGRLCRALRNRNCVALVAEVGETVVGYMVYELHAGRLALRRISVHPAWRRRGVGRLLLGRLAAKLAQTPGGRDQVTAKVSEGWVGAQVFLRACGYWDWQKAGEGKIRFVYRAEG